MKRGKVQDGIGYPIAVVCLMEIIPVACCSAPDRLNIVMLFNQKRISDPLQRRHRMNKWKVKSEAHLVLHYVDGIVARVRKGGIDRRLLDIKFEALGGV